MEPSTILVLSTELAASLGEVTARFARSAVATCPSTILLESTESPASLAAVTALSWIIALVMPGGLVATLIVPVFVRSEEHTSELQSQSNLVCRLLLEKKNDLHIGHSDAAFHFTPGALVVADKLVGDQPIEKNAGVGPSLASWQGCAGLAHCLDDAHAI